MNRTISVHGGFINHASSSLSTYLCGRQLGSFATTGDSWGQNYVEFPFFPLRSIDQKNRLWWIRTGCDQLSTTNGYLFSFEWSTRRPTASTGCAVSGDVLDAPSVSRGRPWNTFVGLLPTWRPTSQRPDDWTSQRSERCWSPW